MAELKIDKEWVKDAVQPTIDRIKAEYIHKSVIKNIKAEVREYSLLTRERVIGIIDKHCGKDAE